MDARYRGEGDVKRESCVKELRLRAMGGGGGG
jgi:hypothetical protein